MAIKFCKKCKSILELKTGKDGKYLICKKCGNREKGGSDFIVKTKLSLKTKVGAGVVEKDLELGHNFKCNKCGNNKCEITDLGMMFGDEDWVYLLKCTKCNHSERVGDWC